MLRADQPFAALSQIAPRVQDQEYYVDHRRDEFWIRTNDKGRSYRLVKTKVATPDPSHWVEVIPHRPEVMLSGIDCFAQTVVLSERENALPRITVLEPEKGTSRRVEFKEAAYTVGPATNAEYAPKTFRYAVEVRGYISQIGPHLLPFKAWEHVGNNAFFCADPDKVPEACDSFCRTAGKSSQTRSSDSARRFFAAGCMAPSSRFSRTVMPVNKRLLSGTKAMPR